ncbi:uncharacterized protein LOC129767136 [Toxorhynchites rutilus septentrionalis]|uniref:uncharacterized protein LOC129767136 n=1 Tax=Toxorhynchites rutilus septentrionalis TaxID=329112 RepID=UPI0024797300|nr:uncharacterized protein LOC129767136 [Toxorhynchites rutilus septentrionalis]
MTANCWRSNLCPEPFQISAGALRVASIRPLLLLILTSAVRLTAGQPQTYEDCEHPPDIAHGTARITVDQSEEFVTAHYSCNAGYRIEGGKTTFRCDIDSDEWQIGELPRCLKDSTNDGGGSSQQQQHQKKRKGTKGQHIQEETAVGSEFASQLDLSCMAQGLIHAPEIDNGYVVKYNR